MDPNQRTSGALLDRANADIAQMLRRFENILALTPDNNHDRNAMAVGAYQMEVETAAMVRAAEDILSLTRILKETWLFGKLQTVGTSEAEKSADTAAMKVAAGLASLTRQGETRELSRQISEERNDEEAMVSPDHHESEIVNQESNK